MKKTLISILALSAVAVFAATSPKVDRVPTIVATGDSNSVMRTAIVSASPTNEYSVTDLTLFCTQSTVTVSTFAAAYVATPTVFVGNATPWDYPMATPTLIATPTTSKLTVANNSLSSPTVRFLIYGIKRVGYAQP